MKLCEISLGKGKDGKVREDRPASPGFEKDCVDVTKSDEEGLNNGEAHTDEPLDG
jgi:hypothetical protein